MDLKLSLIADSFSVETGTGIARYSQELYSGLTNSGVYVNQIFKHSFKIPFGMALNHLIMYPYDTLKESDSDIIHATSPVTALSFPLVNKKCVVTYHDLITILCNDSGANNHARIVAPQIYKTVAKYSDKIIAISSQTKAELISYLKVPESKIQVINLGVDTKFKQLNKSNDCFTIGYVGAFMKRKRVDYLIRAYYILRKKYPKLKTKLVICGKKNLEYSSLNELVIQLGISKYVEFAGFVPDDKLVETYNSFDIFVLPSDWEGFGLPILESQRCGIPVIIRQDAQIPNEVSKYCIKVSSEIDMAQNIAKLLEDAELKENIIGDGLNYSKNFTWERNVKETLALYKTCLGE